MDFITTQETLFAFQKYSIHIILILMIFYFLKSFIYLKNIPFSPMWLSLMCHIYNLHLREKKLETTTSSITVVPSKDTELVLSFQPSSPQ